MSRKQNILISAIDGFCKQIDLHADYFLFERPFLLDEKEKSEIPSDLSARIRENNIAIGVIAQEVQKLL